MARKSKSRKTKKKIKDKERLWCTQDLDFDENGNLCVKNPALSKALKRAIYRTDRRFKIRIYCPTGPTDSDQPGVADTADHPSFKLKKKADDPNSVAADDHGRTPMDAMCHC